MKEEMEKQQGMPETREYFQFGEVLTYFFRKKDPNRKPNFNIRAMHWVNKISIIMFLAAIIVLIIRHVF